MLIAIMKLLYAKNVVISHRKLYFEFFKYDFALRFLLSLRILLIPLILIVAFFILVPNNGIISTLLKACICLIVEIICCKILIGDPLKRSFYEIRTMAIQDWIVRHFVTFKSVISKKEWKKIKKADRELYHDLTVNKHEQVCYGYSLDIARILENVQVLYGSIRNPITKEISAHAVILKDGQIFDSLLLRSFSLEDYKKVFHLQIYKIWNHNEFCAKDFSKKVKVDFVDWCKLNEVKGYEYL